MNITAGRIFIEQNGHIESGNLQLWEYELTGDTTLELKITEAAFVIIIPITGDLFYQLGSAVGAEINVAEVKVLAMPSNSQIRVLNPYLTDMVSFLEIRLKDPFILDSFSYDTASFDFDARQNLLTNVFYQHKSQDYPIDLSIGRFAGRTEVIHTMKANKYIFFAFVIAGAFEVAGRLLQPNDGLSLWNERTIEIEALSNDAILLLIAY